MASKVRTLPRNVTLRASALFTTALAFGTSLLLGVVLAAPVEAQDSDSTTATLTGRVVSAMSGGPLGDARVLLKGSGHGAFTDSTGHFTIRDAPAGRDTLQVSLIGFAEEQVPLTLKPDHTTRVTLMLSETVLRVEDITVEVQSPRREIGKLSEFWDRQERGLGHFITPQEIEEANPQHGSDLLRMVPGVRVGAYQLGQASVSFSRAREGCEPTYYLDGVLRQSMHIDDLNRDDLLAIEVYSGPAETPAQYKFGGRSCGTIVIWTREGRDRRTRAGNGG